MGATGLSVPRSAQATKNPAIADGVVCVRFRQFAINGSNARLARPNLFFYLLASQWIRLSRRNSGIATCECCTCSAIFCPHFKQPIRLITNLRQRILS